MPSEHSKGVAVWDSCLEILGDFPRPSGTVASELSQMSVGGRVQDREGKLRRGHGVSREGGAGEQVSMVEGNGTGLRQLGSWERGLPCTSSGG